MTKTLSRDYTEYTMVRKSRESYKIYGAIKKMNTTQTMRVTLVENNKIFRYRYLEKKKTM